MTGLALPLRFDVGRLRADLAAVEAADWSPHYNQNDYGGRWHGAALRSASGTVSELVAFATTFRDTPLLARCPYFREILGTFDCPLKSVRLLSLEPGSYIREHSDNALDFEDGEVRIHIPIQTNTGVEFYVSGERLWFDEGGAYYVNVNLPHRVSNLGADPRIHLVIDAEVNDWLRDLFARSSDVARIDPPANGVEAFRDSVRLDELRAIDEDRSFIDAAVRLGSATGFDIHPNDVDALLRGAARPGLPRGLPASVVRFAPDPVVEWIDPGDRAPDEPLFADTLRSLLRRPYTRFTRRVAPLPVVANPRPPEGLIFHVSRCGSTLASEVLRTCGFRVISEAPPLDALVSSGRLDWIRSMAHFLGGGQPYILKLDSWHIHSFDLLNAAFPQTPWIFLFRDPGAVLASNSRDPSRPMLPGSIDPAKLGLTLADVTDCPRNEWPARVLTGYFESALRLPADPLGRFLDYAALPSALWTVVAPHFGRRDAERLDLELSPDDPVVDATPPQLDDLYRQLVART